MMGGGKRSTPFMISIRILVHLFIITLFAVIYGFIVRPEAIRGSYRNGNEDIRDKIAFQLDHMPPEDREKTMRDMDRDTYMKLHMKKKATPIEEMIEMFYFSTITHCSIGFGDMAPLDIWGKIATSIHGIVALITILSL